MPRRLRDRSRAKPLAIARANCCARQRRRIAAIGKTVATALQAANALAREGISAAVIDARFAKPLDAPLWTGVARRLGIVVTAEDHARAGGFGSALLELLAESAPGTRVVRLGLPDRFVDHAEMNAQWKDAGIDADAIAEAARCAVRVPYGAQRGQSSDAQRSEAERRSAEVAA